MMDREYMDSEYMDSEYMDSEYESVSFKVEERLKKPVEGLKKDTVDVILSKIFRDKEVLTYNLDCYETSFSSYRKKSLIYGYINAYNNHYPMTISPDIIWLLIMQVFSRFMEKYSELIRERFVNFTGKKEIKINRIGTPLEAFKREDWMDIFAEITTKIGTYVGNDVINKLTPNFSTTTPVSLTTGQLSIMTGMKNYFEYRLKCGGCGVSEITLEGSLKDWENVLEKTKFFDNYALKWWTKHIIPILEKIIETKKYLLSNDKINGPLRKFWKDFIKIKDNSEKYEPDVINGWIIKFFPDIINREVPESILDSGGLCDFFPEQILNCPMKLDILSFDGTKTTCDCSIESGFYGITQDPETFNVKPIIGYSIIVVSKKKENMTVEEKNELIKKFFE